MKNTVVGLCRFSYLAQGGFANAKLSLEDRVAMLFDPKRLDERFAMFETLCLPSLAAQTDRDFCLVVLSSQALPYPAKTRLRALAETYPFLSLAFLPPMGPLISTRRAFRKGWQDGCDYVTGFRIDDDDAVAVDYIARTRQMADRALADGWADGDNPVAISFHRGLYLNLAAPGAPIYDLSEPVPLGQATAMVTAADSTSNVYRWNHRRLAAHVRLQSDPRDLMYIRSFHDHNDSDRSLPPGAVALDDAAARQLVVARFGVDPAALDALRARMAPA